MKRSNGVANAWPEGRLDTWSVDVNFRLTTWSVEDDFRSAFPPKTSDECTVRGSE
jgi:hypothetical protein